MKPFGREKLTKHFLGKVDSHPKKDYINWWEDRIQYKKRGSMNHILKKRIKKEIEINEAQEKNRIFLEKELPNYFLDGVWDISQVGSVKFLPSNHRILFPSNIFCTQGLLNLLIREAKGDEKFGFKLLKT